MISIVIPLYNKEKQIQKTIGTILSQSFQDFEIVIVNDGSTDSSVKNVLAIKDPRIRLINQENGGVSVARNRGIKESKGEFVAFLDADDEWKESYLQTQFELTQKYSNCDVFACNYEFKDANNKVTSTILNRLNITEGSGIISDYFVIASCSHPPLWTSAVMVRKSSILSIGGFPVGITSGEDLLTWARLAVKYQIAYNRSPLAIYNLDESYILTNLPPRRQDSNDPVGFSLEQLYSNNKEVHGFRRYISHWHKMRASVALRFGDRKETVKEVFYSLKWNHLNFKVLLYAFLVLLPYKIRRYIISLYVS